ncbi:hypothetical protein pb186bvf_011355 [Paramecium bursaria]
MGCCQTNPQAQENLSEMLRDPSQHIIEFETNVINLDQKQEMVIKKEQTESKELSKSSQQDGNIPTWSITKTMFVRLNSKKNINESYTIKELIGQGGFGRVYRVIHKSTGLSRAMKVILKEKMKKEDQDKLLEECSIMMEMDHPNIVKLFELYTDETSYFLVSEYCEGGELFEKIKQFQILTEKEIAGYMKQILSAVAYCHSRGVVHRDLKPENILFDGKKENAQIKIIDFGASAKLLNNEKLKKRIGTPFYVAPEVLNANYDEKCDIWSLGVILYILLCGYPPFFGHSEQEVLQKVKKGLYTFDTNDWSKVSIQAKDLIRRMLFFEPQQRIAAKDAYNHHWIIDNKVKGQLNNSALRKLQNFDSKNKLKYAIMQYITLQVISSQEKEEMLKSFQEIDNNGDGTVSKEELFQGTPNLISIAYVKVFKGDKVNAQTLVDELFQQLDANNSGKVDFSEFVTATINREKILSKKKIEQSFKLFDLDGNGYITRIELTELFGGEVDDQMWQQILQECDENHDGQISLPEFIKLIDYKIQKNDK